MNEAAVSSAGKVFDDLLRGTERAHIVIALTEAGIKTTAENLEIFGRRYLELKKVYDDQKEIMPPFKEILSLVLGGSENMENVSETTLKAAVILSGAFAAGRELISLINASVKIMNTQISKFTSDVVSSADGLSVATASVRDTLSNLREILSKSISSTDEEISAQSGLTKSYFGAAEAAATSPGHPRP